MAIQDIAGNPFASGSTAQMLGYTEPVASEELLALEMYRFLIDEIRIEDSKNGHLFVKRYMEGFQEVWRTTQAKIFAIKDLWDLENIPDAFLTYLKNILGWTGKLEEITNLLDAPTLRKLLGTSAALWKQRGAEDTLQDVLELTTGSRTRVWNWFDFRWVLDETETSEEHQGRDSWIINLPGAPDYDEYKSNLRIVDDGSLDHDVVEKLTKLMRASGERWEISYIDFLDRFIIDGDDTQWFESGEDVPTVDSGVATLADDTTSEKAVVSLDRAYLWSDYAAYFRLRATPDASGDKFGVLFYWTDNQNYYAVEVDLLANSLALVKYVSGTPTTIVTASYAAFGFLYPAVYYAYRIEVTDEGATNRIKVYVDGNEVINTTDSSLTQGSVGFFHAVDVAATELDEVELFQFPLETTLIDVNN